MVGGSIPPFPWALYILPQDILILWWFFLCFKSCSIAQISTRNSTVGVAGLLNAPNINYLVSSVRSSLHNHVLQPSVHSVCTSLDVLVQTFMYFQVTSIIQSSNKSQKMDTEKKEVKGKESSAQIDERKTSWKNYPRHAAQLNRILLSPYPELAFGNLFCEGVAHR